jgi:hypothetical protein
VWRAQLYHEATLVNLFEVVLYHKHACEACGDNIVELVDYCARKLTYLNAHDAPPRTAPQTLDGQQQTIEFNAALGCIALVRYMAEYVSVLPVGVTRRLLDSCGAPRRACAGPPDTRAQTCCAC